MEKLKEQLKQSSQLNIRLKNQLDEVNALHTQTLVDKDNVIRDLSQQVETLQTQLENTSRTFTELERRLTDANTKLEFYASSLNGNHDETLLEREQELELLKQEMEELRRLQVNSNRISSDMGSQTSPARGWAQVSSDKLRELERRFEESRQTCEQYKNILDEKEMELQQLKQKVGDSLCVLIGCLF